ncbi:hypothetical protein LSAT2_011670 [Lamellibrachia satsuma]|nr:hypothetical protein LSAT2_011670 [Lamellibrachia satsuma]
MGRKLRTLMDTIRYFLASAVKFTNIKKKLLSTTTGQRSDVSYLRHNSDHVHRHHTYVTDNSVEQEAVAVPEAGAKMLWWVLWTGLLPVPRRIPECLFWQRTVP